MPVAVIIMFASVYGVARLAARIYAGAIVRGGSRLSRTAALRLRGDCLIRSGSSGQLEVELARMPLVRSASQAVLIGPAREPSAGNA
jgi:hypothetical protein